MRDKALLLLLVALLATVSASASAPVALAAQAGQIAYGSTVGSQSSRQQQFQAVEYAGYLALGDVRETELASALSAHIWDFEGQRGDRITIRMEALEESLDPFLLLLSADDFAFETLSSLSSEQLTSLVDIADELGVLLAFNDDDGQSTNALIADVTLPDDGAYFIIATSCCTGESFGAYRLWLEEPRAQGRWLEFAGGLDYGSIVEADLPPELVAHVWEFFGQEGDEIFVRMDALDSGLDPFLLLLRASPEELDEFVSLGEENPFALVNVASEFGILFAANDDSEGSANALIDSEPLPVTGSYYIVATSCCTGESAGAYSLTLDRAGPAGAGPGPERFPDDDSNFIPETTRIIDAGVAASYLDGIDGDGETIVFSQAIVDAIGRPFSVDDIVALDPVEAAPDGLLRRVVDVDSGGGQFILSTVQASLEEAIYNGEVRVHVVLTEDGGHIAQASPRQATAKPGIRPTAAEFTINLPRQEIIPGVTATGKVDLDPSFDFELVIRRFKVEWLRIVNTTSQEAQITLEAKRGFTGREEVRLRPLGKFAPIGIPILGTRFNIWLTPQLTVYLGVSGSAKAAVKSAVRHAITYDSGLEYDGDDLHLIADSYGQRLSIDEPKTSVGVDASAYIKPEFALVVFGGSGPYINAQGYVRFDADMCQSPWWEVYAGVRGDVGARVKMFSFKFIDETWPIFGQEWTLDEAKDSAPFACPTGNQPAPAANTPQPPAQPPAPTPPSGNGGCFAGAALLAVLGLFTYTRRKRE